MTEAVKLHYKFNLAITISKHQSHLSIWKNPSQSMLKFLCTFCTEGSDCLSTFTFP